MAGMFGGAKAPKAEVPAPPAPMSQEEDVTKKVVLGAERVRKRLSGTSSTKALNSLSSSTGGSSGLGL